MTEASRRTVFLSGATGALGQGIAAAFKGNGDRVIGFQRGDSAAFTDVSVSCDLSREGFDARVVTDAIAAHGAPQVIIANSGIADNAPAMMLPPDRFADVVDLNLNGAYRFVQPCLRPMLRSAGASIVLISSSAAVMGSAGQANYAASKAGLAGLCRSLARELGPRGIRVNALLVGLLNGDGLAAAMTPENRQALTSRTCLQRLAEPAEIAASVLWLASAAASYITGASIAADGGLSMGY